MAGPIRVAVIEDALVLARGLAAFVLEALPEAEVTAHPEPEVLWAPGSAVQLVVCGPSALSAYCGLLADDPRAVAAMAVVTDAAKIDFAAPLAVGIDVLWDFRGSQASFAAALQAALNGQAWVSESIAGPMTSDLGVQLRRGLRAADYGLTPRESEILQLLATGASNKDIAAMLFISQNTVKNHVRAVLDRLHAGSRTEAVMIGARAGLIDIRGGRV